MKRATIALLGLAAVGFAGGSEAASGAGRPSYGGTGCPAGTASVRVSGLDLEVRFSAYKVAAGGSTGKTFDRKACGLSLPVAVPRGRSVAIIGAEYRGYQRLAAGTKGQFRAEYFFAGSTGPVGTRTFSGPAQGAFVLTTPGKQQVWSACGADVIVRVNSSLRVSTSQGRPASLSVRSQEVDNAVVYRLRWRDC